MPEQEGQKADGKVNAAAQNSATSAENAAKSAENATTNAKNTPNPTENNKVLFDSAKIGEKEKAEQFSKIEGEEDRAKAAERMAKEAETEEKAIHQEDIKAAVEREKENKRAQKRKDKLQNQIDGATTQDPQKVAKKQKRSFIIRTVVILILLAAAIGTAAYFLIFFKREGQKPKSEPKVYAQEIYEKVKDAEMDTEFGYSSEEQRNPYFENEIDKAQNDEEKFYLIFEYLTYLSSIDDEVTMQTQIEKIEALSYQDESCKCQIYFHKLYASMIEPEEDNKECPLYAD